MYIAADGLGDAVRGSCVAARGPRRPRGATRVRVPQADVPRHRIVRLASRAAGLHNTPVAPRLVVDAPIVVVLEAASLVRDYLLLTT